VKSVKNESNRKDVSRHVSAASGFAAPHLKHLFFAANTTPHPRGHGQSLGIF